MGGALVRCGSYSGSRETRSGPDGSFVFEDLEQSIYYLFVALTPDAQGEEHSDFARISLDPIRLELKEVLYERLRFVDQYDEPIRDVSTADVYFHGAQALWSSGLNDEYDLALRHPLACEGVGALAENEVAYMSDFALFTRGKLLDPEYVRCIHVAGFRPRDVPVEPWPLKRWPEARTVVLVRDRTRERRVPYRVHMPRTDVPEGWEKGSYLPFRLFVTSQGATGASHLLTHGHDLLHARRSATLFLFHPRESPLEFQIVERSGEFEVQPDYPKYGFLDLTFPPVHPRHTHALGFAKLVSASGVEIDGYRYERGTSRFAYLLPGVYTLRIEWESVKQVAAPLPWHLKEPIRVEAGLNQHTVRVDR